jgi:hypothetical protein
MINSLNHRFRDVDRSVTAVFMDQDTAENEEKKAHSLQISLYSGQKTLNDVRSEQGEPLYDMPEADEPFIVAGNAITFLKGLLETDESGETVGQTTDAPAQGGEDAEPEEPIKLPPTPQANLTEPAKQDEQPQEIEIKAADGDSYTPPKGVQEEAQRALDWIKEGHAGSGFTDTGRKRAADLAAGRSVSLETIKRIASFLARHEVDKKGEGWSPGDEGYPSPGRVAWAAWGGDAAKSWVNSIVDSSKSVDDEMKAFRSFVAKRKQAGKWRDFVFDHVDAEVAKVLNDQARETILKKKPIQAGRRVTYQEQTA